MSIVGFSGQSPRFSPQDVPGLSLWLDAADAGTVTRSGSNVTSWQDKSGFQNHATSRDGFPTYTTSGINGRPALTFSNAPSMTGTLSITGTTLTGFLMIQGSQSGSGRNDQRIVSCATSGAADWNSTARFLVGIQGGGNVVRYNRGNSIIPQATIPIGSPALLTWQSDGTSNFIWEDGSAGDVLASVANGDTFSITNYGLGNQFTATTETYNGLIGEVLIYTSSLTAYQRRSVEAYLARKWGTTTTLVPGHPARSSVTPMRNFVPTDLDGCALWIDALDSSAYTLSGSTVTGVLDKSSNAWPLGSATNFTMNSTPFNGTYPSFYGTGGQLGSNGSFTLSQPMTIYFVGQAIQYNLSTFLFDGASGGRVVIYAGSVLFAGGEFGATNRDSAVPFPHVMVAVVNGASSSVILNGVTTNGNPGTNGFGGIRLSSRNTGGDPYIGHICELLIFSGAHTDAQTQLMTGYLNSKWGLRNLAMGGTTHPFRYGPPGWSLPSTIASLGLWLDAADSTSFTLSGNNVTQWRDKSSNAFTGTAVNSPVLTTVGGVPAVTFNGSTQYISFGDVADLGSDQMQLFIVCKFETTGNGTLVAKSRAADATWRYALIRENGSLVPILQGDVIGAGLNATVADSSTSRRILSMNWDRSTMTLYQNGTSIRTAAYSNTSTFNSTYPLLIGAYNNTSGGVPPVLYLNGSINEILLFLAPLTTNQRQQIEGYLAWKWNLSTNLPGPSTIWNRFYRPLFPEFTPVQIPGCTLWLDAADRSTLTLSGTTVTTWTDKTGNGFSATGVNGVSYSATSNGVAFSSNSSQYMDLSDGCFPTGNSSYTYMLIFTPTTTNQVQLITGGNNNGGEKFGLRTTSGGGLNTYWFGYDLATSNTFTANTRTFGATYYQSGGGRSVWLNFIQGASDTPGTRNQGSGNNNLGTLGPNRAFESYDGQFHEILVFSNSLSTGDRQRMEGYLAWKWGMTSSLPSNHPFKRTKP